MSWLDLAAMRLGYAVLGFWALCVLYVLGGLLRSRLTLWYRTRRAVAHPGLRRVA